MYWFIISSFLLSVYFEKICPFDAIEKHLLSEVYSIIEFWCEPQLGDIYKKTSILKRETYKSKYKQVLMSTVYALIIVASVAAIVATLIMPVLQISGSSMNPTLSEGEIVVSIKNQNLKTGDVWTAPLRVDTNKKAV